MRYIYDFDNSCDDYFVQHLKINDNALTMHSAHYHDCFEFYFYLGDDMTYFIDNRSYRIKKYDLVFVNINTFHRTFYKTNHNERILFMFKECVFDFLKDSSPVMNALKFISATPVMTFDKETQQVIRDFASRIANSRQKDNAYLSAIAIADFTLTIEHFIKRGLLVNDTSDVPHEEIKITDITNYILQNFDRKILLDELAAKFYISKYHLCRKFKEKTGQTVIDFINEKRLIQAKKMLISTDHTVIEIAMQVGFDSPNHFNTLFKKKFGMTPYNYKISLRHRKPDA